MVYLAESFVLIGTNALLPRIEGSFFKGDYFMRNGICGLALLAAVCGQAHATAIAEVKQAVWQADFAYYLDPTGGKVFALPSGVVLMCAGGAYSDGFGGCTNSLGAKLVSDGPSLSKNIDETSGLVLHNTSGINYAGSFVFNTKYSSFNPFGPSAGAKVEYPAAEYASYFSVVAGPGAFDLNGCEMSSGGMEIKKSPSSCGKPSTFKTNVADLGPLLAGESLSADYNIQIRLTATGLDPVPESPSLPLLFAGLGSLALCRRFTANRRKAR